MSETKKPENYTNLIALALFNKSRLAFRYYKYELAKQAEYFSPIYRDFIYKVICNNSLLITYNYKESFIKIIDFGEPSEKLSKKYKNKI